MRPVLFNIPLPWIGPIPVRAYGFMVMLGCLAGVFVALRRAKKEGVDRNIIWDIWMWCLIGGFVGARVLYVGLYWPQFRDEFTKVFHIWEGGLAFQGGLAGALLLTYIYLKVKRLTVVKYVEIVVAGAILGYAFARVGCFLNGCCHGHVTTVAWAVTYPAAAPVDARGTLRPSPAYAAQELANPTPMPAWLRQIPAYKDRVSRGRLTPAWASYVIALKQALSLTPDRKDPYDLTEDQYLSAVRSGLVEPMPRSAPIHPTQIYAIICAIVIFVLLTLYWRLPHHVGQVGALFGVLYALYRFVVEFFRGDSSTPYWGMTLFQVVCIAIFLFFGGMWLWCQGRMPKYLPPAAK